MNAINVFAGVMMWFIPLMILIVLALVVLKQYKICPNDKVMVVYGIGSGKGAARIVHGGGTLVIPFFQGYRFMSLSPMSITVNLDKALSANNIRVNVPSQFTISLASKHPELMQNAARYLLESDEEEIRSAASEIIIGSLRAVVATLSIEELTRDREQFITLINDNVRNELNKVGMDLVNVNIRDITDESGYIEAMGKKAAAEAVNTAEIDVAEQQRLGAIGVETNNRERDVTVAEQQAQADIGKKTADRDRDMRVATLQAETVTEENKAKADIADSNASLAVREADAYKLSEVSRAQADKQVAVEQRHAEQARIAKEQLPEAEIAKEKVEIEAEANAEEVRRIARGNADAMLMKYAAEAEGLQKVLEAKAVGYQRIVEAAGSPNAAATLLMIEKMEEIIRIQTDAIKNLQIDKITVWDSGSGGNDGLKGFIQNFSSSLPPLHEIASQAGIELPEFMGQIAGEAEKAVATDKSAESR